MAASDAEIGLDRLDEKVIKLLAALPTRGDGRPVPFTPLLAELALGALSDFTIDDDESDLLCHSICRTIR